jgi:prophage regulatory protein
MHQFPESATHPIFRVYDTSGFLLSAFVGWRPSLTIRERIMHQFPETGFVRLPQIIGNPNAVPPIPPIIPIKKSAWWEGVRIGRFPKPVKFGRCTMWRVEDIRALIASV